MPSVGLMWSRRDADSHPPPSLPYSTPSSFHLHPHPPKNPLEDQLRLSKEHAGADVNHPPPPARDIWSGEGRAEEGDQRIYISDRWDSTPLRLPNICPPNLSLICLQYTPTTWLSDRAGGGESFLNHSSHSATRHVWSSHHWRVPANNDAGALLWIWIFI